MWVSTWFWNAPNVSLFIVPTRVSGCTTDPCTYKSGFCSGIPSLYVGRGVSGTFFRLRLAMHYSERLRILSLCFHNGILWMKSAGEGLPGWNQFKSAQHDRRKQVHCLFYCIRLQDNSNLFLVLRYVWGAPPKNPQSSYTM